MLDLIDEKRVTVSLVAPVVAKYQARKRARYWTAREDLSRPTVVLQNLSCIALDLMS